MIFAILARQLRHVCRDTLALPTLDKRRCIPRGTLHEDRVIQFCIKTASSSFVHALMQGAHASHRLHSAHGFLTVSDVDRALLKNAFFILL